jgi:hypothetical protein
VRSLNLALVSLLLLFASSAQAADCKPRNLTEYFACLKGQQAEKTLGVFKTAGESSSYWPCMNDAVAAADKQAKAGNNPIDTADELSQTIIGAQVACDGRFPAFKAALLKEAADEGYENDIKSDDELKFLVYQLWYAALTSPS